MYAVQGKISCGAAPSLPAAPPMAFQRRLILASEDDYSR
jgi:hypothetical protein